MVARVMQGVVSEGRMDEVIRMMEVLGPKAQELPGSKGLLVLTHAGSGQAISVSLWESTEALEATETSGFLDHQISQILPLLDESPSARIFEVSGEF